MKTLTEVLQKIQQVHVSRISAIQAQLDDLTKPQGSLGRLEELARRYCLITGRDKPVLKNKIIFTCAGDHGVTKEGVSAYPSAVTPQMVLNFLRGGAGVNVLARQAGAELLWWTWELTTISSRPMVSRSGRSDAGRGISPQALQ